MSHGPHNCKICRRRQLIGYLLILASAFLAYGLIFGAITLK